MADKTIGIFTANAVEKAELTDDFDIADRQNRNARIQDISAAQVSITPPKTTDE